MARYYQTHSDRVFTLPPDASAFGILRTRLPGPKITHDKTQAPVGATTGIGGKAFHS